MVISSPLPFIEEEKVLAFLASHTEEERKNVVLSFISVADMQATLGACFMIDGYWFRVIGFSSYVSQYAGDERDKFVRDALKKFVQAFHLKDECIVNMIHYCLVDDFVAY